MSECFKLELIDGKLCLTDLENPKLTPLFVDFINGKVGFRRKRATLKTELLSKALGAKKGLRVLDATAGLGRDAFILAELGYDVTALEKSKTVFQLLQDGLKRAAYDHSAAEAVTRLKVYNQDFLEFTKALNSSHTFDAVYLDPMFPALDKTSLPQKEMQILQKLHRGDSESSQLEMLGAALKIAARVVVKRPLSEPPLKQPVTAQFKGKSIRFDVYKG